MTLCRGGLYGQVALCRGGLYGQVACVEVAFIAGSILSCIHFIWTKTYVCTCIEPGMITAPGAVSIDWLKVTCPRCDLITMFARPFLSLSAWMPDRDGQLARPGTSFLVLRTCHCVCILVTPFTRIIVGKWMWE